MEVHSFKLFLIMVAIIEIVVIALTHVILVFLHCSGVLYWVLLIGIFLVFNMFTIKINGK